MLKACAFKVTEVVWCVMIFANKSPLTARLLSALNVHLGKCPLFIEKTLVGAFNKEKAQTGNLQTL